MTDNVSSFFQTSIISPEYLRGSRLWVSSSTSLFSSLPTEFPLVKQAQAEIRVQMDICTLPEGLTCLLGKQPLFGKLSPEGLYMATHKCKNECKCLCSEALCIYLGATRPHVLLQMLPVGVFQKGAACLGFSARPGFTNLTEASFRQACFRIQFYVPPASLMVLEMPLDPGSGMGLPGFSSVLCFAESPCLTLGKPPNLSGLD